MPKPGGAVALRPIRPGDLGWIIGRHGAIYAQEYGFDISFEILVAESLAGLMRKFDPARDAGWIAEIDGVAVGSVMLVHDADNTAKLRFLILDAGARGRGVGRLLVETALRFARQTGYARISLWTMEMLSAARAIYAALGFQLISSTSGHNFGVDTVDEVWAIDLTQDPAAP